MKYSLTQGGLLAGVAGILLVQYGFSDSCSSEITAKLLPLIGAFPGLATAWIGRYRAGGVTFGGFKK
jgi:ABC-type uncharacterized transport system permease subunit